jgi:hypothetical protein
VGANSPSGGTDLSAWLRDTVAEPGTAPWSPDPEPVSQKGGELMDPNTLVAILTLVLGIVLAIRSRTV